MTRRLSGRWVGRTLALLIARDGPACARCGAATVPGDRHPLRPSVGHAVPLALGGTNDLDNLRVEHLGCNVRAGATTDPIALLALAPVEAGFCEPGTLSGNVPSARNGPEPDYLRRDASR